MRRHWVQDCSHCSPLHPALRKTYGHPWGDAIECLAATCMDYLLHASVAKQRKWKLVQRWAILVNTMHSLPVAHISSHARPIDIPQLFYCAVFYVWFRTPLLLSTTSFLPFQYRRWRRAPIATPSVERLANETRVTFVKYCARAALRRWHWLCWASAVRWRTLWTRYPRDLETRGGIVNDRRATRRLQSESKKRKRHHLRLRTAMSSILSRIC